MGAPSQQPGDTPEIEGGKVEPPFFIGGCTWTGLLPQEQTLYSPHVAMSSYCGGWSSLTDG